MKFEKFQNPRVLVAVEYNSRKRVRVCECVCSKRNKPNSFIPAKIAAPTFNESGMRIILDIAICVFCLTNRVRCTKAYVQNYLEFDYLYA